MCNNALPDPLISTLVPPAVCHRQPLLRAALAGDAGTLRILLDKHASLDHYVGKDRSPLEAAASQGYLEACEVLIKHGAKADARDLKGSTPLHMACQNGSVAIAEMMLATAGGPAETEAMANLARDDGVTPIIIAAHNGSMELLEVLLSKGAQVTRQATRGAPTALHAAVQGGHVEMTKRLLDLGVDVNVKKQARPPHAHRVSARLPGSSSARAAHETDPPCSLLAVQRHASHDRHRDWAPRAHSAAL